MKRNSSPSRPYSELSERLNQRLNMYAAAAGAAGVGLLALTPPANAEIIYTPTDVVISPRSMPHYALDVNQDGVTDFSFTAFARQSIDQSGGTSAVVVMPAPSNGVLGYGNSAAAMPAGQAIGSARKFTGRFMASLFTFIGTEFRWRGKWAQVANHYLGLKFQINGQTHYGWARFTVGGRLLKATLTGYAYETLANTPIVAGKTSGTDAASLPLTIDHEYTACANLGALALGAPALSMWRREETTVC